MYSPEKKKEFEKIAFQHMDALYSTALRMTRNTEEAEDLVQDTYLRAFRFFDKYELGTNFRAWIFRILINTFINKYRKKVKMPDQVQIDKVEFMLESEKISSLETQLRKVNENNYKAVFDDRIAFALSKLSYHYRVVVILAYVADFSYKEIAKIIGRPIGTVMSRLFRARQILQKSLSSYAAHEGYLHEVEA